MRLYFVRHGESTANLAHEFANEGWNHPLTALGVSQAQQVAWALLGLNPVRIYSSPVQRAVQTAEIIGATLTCQVEVSEALREWRVGLYEGTSEPLGWELHRRVQEDWYVRHEFDHRMPGGESLNDIRSRFVPFISGLVSAFSDTPRDVILVGHGGLFIAMLPVIFTNVDWAFASEHGFPVTAVTIARPHLGKLHCISWCGYTPD
ncbi:MAG: histidine phosphatase family protein [Anaerolineae bacterium]